MVAEVFTVREVVKVVQMKIFGLALRGQRVSHFSPTPLTRRRFLTAVAVNSAMRCRIIIPDTFRFCVHFWWE